MQARYTILWHVFCLSAPLDERRSEEETPVTRYAIAVDLDRCMGCYTCVLACKQRWLSDTPVQYNHVETVEWGVYPEAHQRFIPLFCHQCLDPACKAVCPENAIEQTPEGPVIIDRTSCVGCGACKQACPYGCITLTGASASNVEPHAEKCTLCYPLIKQGEIPACVALCTTSCLIFGDLDDEQSELSQFMNTHETLATPGSCVFYTIPRTMRADDLATCVSNRPVEAPRSELPSGAQRDNGMPIDAAAKDHEEATYSICALCNQAPFCGMKVVQKDGVISRIEKREGYPNNNLCVKGMAATQDLYHPARLLYPQKRLNPKGEPSVWERISWDEALSTIAEKFNTIKDSYGAEKVLFMTGDPKEPRSALQRLAFTFGSPNMGTESSTCYKACELAMKLTYGVEGKISGALSTGSFPTPGITKICIIWGTNPTCSSVNAFKRLMKAKESGVRFIVIDPRVTQTVELLADIHLQPRPGTDGALALALGDYLIAHNAYDQKFVAQWTFGFSEYAQLCHEYPLERAAEICGLPLDLLQQAADLLIDCGSPLTIKCSAAFPHHKEGINTLRALFLLLPLTGSIDVPGGIALPDEPLNLDEWRATYEFSRAQELLPRLDHLRVDRPYVPVWADTDWQGSIQVNMLPEYVQTGQLRAALLLGVNTLMWPQSSEYQHALDNMDFVVAADYYCHDWTHNHVDMLLPAAMSFERSAPLSIFGRNFFLREPIVALPGEVRSDYRICCDIGTALGFAKEFWGGGPESEENCLREILRTLNVENPPTLEDLRAAVPGPVAIPLSGKSQTRKYEQGLLRADGKPGFPTPSGNVEFASSILQQYGFDPLPSYHEPAESPLSTPDLARRYPLVLTVGARVPFYAHSKERELPWLAQFMPEPLVGMSPQEADVRGLKNGEHVLITSPVCPEGIVMKLEATETIRPGMIVVPHGWAQANGNQLVPRDFDPISGFPTYREGLCEVTRYVSEN